MLKMSLTRLCHFVTVFSSSYEKYEFKMNEKCGEKYTFTNSKFEKQSYFFPHIMNREMYLKKYFLVHLKIFI